MTTELADFQNAYGKHIMAQRKAAAISNRRRHWWHWAWDELRWQVMGRSWVRQERERRLKHDNDQRRA